MSAAEHRDAWARAEAQLHEAEDLSRRRLDELGASEETVATLRPALEQTEAELAAFVSSNSQAGTERTALGERAAVVHATELKLSEESEIPARTRSDEATNLQDLKREESEVLARTRSDRATILKDLKREEPEALARTRLARYVHGFNSQSRGPLHLTKKLP